MVPPLFPPPLTPSPSSPQPPVYLHQSCYPPAEVNCPTVKRPWYLWCIGNLEILKSVCYMAIVIYLIFYTPPSPDDFLWIIYFLGVLGILTGFFQGIGLISGLRSDDDAVTLWYCQVWVYCQRIFIVIGSIAVAAGLVSLYRAVFSVNDSALIPLVLIAGGLYPLVSYLAVQNFANQLKRNINETNVPCELPN